MAPELNLTAFRCHKVVRAARIVRADYGAGLVVVEDAAGQHVPLTNRRDLMHRRIPVEGDYYVAYGDGYDSISPRAAFEAGYTEERDAD